jgi:hypothetical protein
MTEQAIYTDNISDRLRQLRTLFSSKAIRRSRYVLKLIRHSTIGEDMEVQLMH